jgi:aryl-alcohol dehydrogenase-like predicted oxidoreductase
MADDKLTRRDFVKAGSLMVAGAVVGTGTPLRAEPPRMDPTKVRNFNPKMGYRRLGKSDVWISEVSLGGHGGSGLENRKQVLARAAELGINYLDTNMVAECQVYGQALHELKLRDSFYVGFESWPFKAHEADTVKVETMTKLIEERLKDYHTDCLDMWRPVGSTGPGDLTSVVTDRSLDTIAETFEQMKQQGKLRFLGLSSHHPPTIRKIISHPAYTAVLFPYFFMTKEKQQEGMLPLCEKHDVGAIAIKPMAAGFIKGETHTVHLKKILQSKGLTAALPGVNNVQQLEQDVQASYTRDVPLTEQQTKALADEAKDFYARLPEQYQWLRNWEYV